MAIGNPINLTSNVEGKSISVSATAGQTQFTVTGGYRINQISVYRNGVRLVDGRDFTATDGSIVTLLSAATVADVLEFQVFDDFRVSDALNVNSGGTVNGDVTVNGALTVSTTTITGTATTAQGLTGSPDIAVTNITAGIITATTFSGNGSALTGVASTDNIITGTAATFTSDVNIADSIIHVGDTNTKIRFPAADTFTVETGGTERFRVDSGGDVGIGTATVDNTLHVYKSGDGQTPVFFETSNGTPGELKFYNDSAGWQLNSGGDLRFATDGSTRRITIDTSGRLMLGTTTEGNGGADEFTISTSEHTGMTLRSGTTHQGNIFFSDGTSGDNEFRGIIRYNHNDNSMQLRTNATEALRIDSSQRLLISTTNSRSTAGTGADLQVETTDAGGRISVVQNRNDATACPFVVIGKSRGTSIGSNTVLQDDDRIGAIVFAGADGTDMGSDAARIIAEVDGTPGSNDMPGRLIFSTTADGSDSATERVRIDNAGDILVSRTGAANGSTTDVITLDNDNSNSNDNLKTSIAFKRTGNNSSQIYSRISSERTGTHNTDIVFQTTDGLTLGEELRILSTGGITFNGDTAAANALDDYEEGTFTPTATNFTVSGTSTLTGQYVKIGRQVTIGIKFANTGTIAHGTSAFIGGLPFSMASGTEAHGLIGMLDNSNSTAFNSNKSGTQCKLDGEGGSRFFPGSFTTTSSGAQLLFGGTYISAS